MLVIGLRLVSFFVSAILLLFNGRRILLTGAAFGLPRRPLPRPSNAELPTVLILVPCRDEVELLSGLTHALEKLLYPQHKLQMVLIDDGSHDGTARAMNQFKQTRDNVHVLSLHENVGKANALNMALLEYPFGEIVYVVDADHRPAPELVLAIAKYFCEPNVAGVAGYTRVSNALASPSAYYSAVESSVHQMITMRGKDRLDLAPAMLGGSCAYRRKALVECGGFQPGAFLEDSDLTVRLSRAGYHLRFAEEAIAYFQVPETRGGYVKQHARWGRGYNDVAREHALGLLRQRELRPLLRLELILFSVGYLDRLALLGAGGLTLLSLLDPHRYKFPRWILPLALVTPFAQIVALFIEQRMSLAMWLRLPLVPIFFALDIYAALRALMDSLLNREHVWSKTERSLHDE